LGFYKPRAPILINQALGKLTPAHPDVLPILKEIRENYQIPEISPLDNSLQILLRHELEFDWKEIQEKLKNTPDILDEGLKKLYEGTKEYQEKGGIKDPELDKVSQEFRDNFHKMNDILFELFLPTVNELDKLFHTIGRKL
jgi:hypothetical protein